MISSFPTRAALFAASCLAVALGTASCASTSSVVQAPVAGAPRPEEPVSLLDVPPAAVVACDAPGLNVEDLTARVRDTIQASSGVRAVDMFSVRAELAACGVPPCKDEATSAYRDARFIVASSVSPIGDAFFASVRVMRNVEELARATAQGPRAQSVVEEAARTAGATLRRALLAAAAPPGAGAAAPNDGERAPPGDGSFGNTERGSDG